jgi:hypothetical protein
MRRPTTPPGAATLTGAVRAAARFAGAHLQRTLLVLLAIAGISLVVVGVALVFAPAGLVIAGLALLALVTFDPARAGRLTWPR